MGLEEAFFAVEVSSSVGIPDRVFRGYDASSQMVSNLIAYYFVSLTSGTSRRSLHDVTEGVVFQLIQLQFPEDDVDDVPLFSHVTSFQIHGHPCNLFLLDTSAHLLATFVCLSSSNNIALHVLHDWNEDAYSFIDTGIEWVSTRLVA